MKKNGSVTVTFSLVFLLLFSFLLSFFEMAAYTSRGAYHAAAARLAVENYFAGYTAPLYSEYHIFGRMVPKREEAVLGAQEEILRDVKLMTQKQEGQLSLLLRDGAQFEVAGVSFLTDRDGEGFYRQATRAMQYRSVAEVANLVKEYLGLSGQLQGQLRLMSGQAETATAYAAVEKEILKLMELVDGVKLSQYELFLRGKATVFQTKYYVKYFCTDGDHAADFFDRVEVYRAFEENHRNPYAVLILLSEKTGRLAQKVKKREQEQQLCSEEREALSSGFLENSATRQLLVQERKACEASQKSLEQEQKKLRKKKNRTEAEQVRLVELASLLEKNAGHLLEIEARETELEIQYQQLVQRQQEVDQKEAGLKQEEEEQKKEFQQLAAEEKELIREAREVRSCCSQALQQVEAVKKELRLAILARKRCEELLNTLRPVLGEEASAAAQEELRKYEWYESAQGYDFDRMAQTLFQNSVCLNGLTERLQTADSGALLRAASELAEEKLQVKNYSFNGLKLSYGEFSLAGSVKEQATGILENAFANSFLELLTEEELAQGQLELSYLPSGFQYAQKGEQKMTSLLKMELGELFGTLSDAFSEDGELAEALTAISDPVLFQAYLMTHFQDYSKPGEDTVLRYELEYLVEGAAGDRENLSGVMTRICLLRTAEHLVALYMDRERRAPAEAAALAACGAIGLPAMKEVFVFLFLLVWALEEAAVDGAALLAGKKIALFPGKQSGSIAFPELVLFSGSLVREKAKEKKNPVGLGVSYRDFLQLYLLMTPKQIKCFRAMDLIQENLRGWYQSSFRLRSCVWQLEYQTDQRSYQYSYLD